MRRPVITGSPQVRGLAREGQKEERRKDSYVIHPSETFEAWGVTGPTDNLFQDKHTFFRECYGNRLRISVTKEVEEMC
jgi:hypothetical protein